MLVAVVNPLTFPTTDFTDLVCDCFDASRIYSTTAERFSICLNLAMSYYTGLIHWATVCKLFVRSSSIPKILALAAICLDLDWLEKLHHGMYHQCTPMK